MYIIFYLISFLLFKIKLIKNLKITKRVIIQFIIFILCLSLNFLVIINKYCYLIYNLFCYWISFAISVLIEKLKQKYYIKKAKEKLKNYKTKTIAITGSYGKTSCKNYIYEFLKDKYNVLISPHSYNTLNGMLLTINKSLKPYHNYLILEIGVDEKKGMNKFINNFSFDYCAVTCIGYQHLSTFKTIDNIAKEKCKLLNASTIMSIYNKDDFYIKIDIDKEKRLIKITDTGIGMTKEEAEKLISVGDKVSFKKFFEKMGENRVTATYIDDRGGIAVLLKALEYVNTDKKITLVCSAQEETGGTGATCAAYNVDADLALAVDVSFAATPDADPKDCGKMNGGAMIGYSPALSREYSELLVSLAKEYEIPYQKEIMNGRTGTNADHITISKSGIPTALVSLPQRNMHTPVEMVDIRDIESCAKLIARFIERV